MEGESNKKTVREPQAKNHCVKINGESYNDGLIT